MRLSVLQQLEGTASSERSNSRQWINTRCLNIVSVICFNHGALGHMAVTIYRTEATEFCSLNPAQIILPSAALLVAIYTDSMFFHITPSMSSGFKYMDSLQCVDIGFASAHECNFVSSLLWSVPYTIGIDLSSLELNCINKQQQTLRLYDMASFCFLALLEI